MSNLGSPIGSIIVLVLLYVCRRCPQPSLSVQEIRVKFTQTLDDTKDIGKNIKIQIQNTKPERCTKINQEPNKKMND